MSGWEIVVLLSKSATYSAMLAIPGAFLVRFLLVCASQRAAVPADAATLRHLLRPILLYYLFPAVILGVLSVSLFFLAQVGDVNQQGIPGMFDRDMAAILATTALGDGVQWRFNGFLVSALALALLYTSLRLPETGNTLGRVASILAVLASLTFAWSFAVLGHTSVLTLDVQIAIALHFLSVGVWVGALYPLWLLCRICDRSEDSGQRLVLSQLMENFGKAGWYFIALLLISGFYLLVNLLDHPAAVLTTTYGRLLLLKLILVAGLMALGAYNKFRLVPALRTSSHSSAAILRLRRSIQVEMALVVLALVVTAGFTTVTGPML